MDTDTTAVDSGISTESTQATPDTSSQGMDTSSPPADTATGSLPTQSQASTDPSASANGTAQPPVTSDPKAGSPQAPAWDDPSNPYLKRFNDTLAHTQRLFQQKQELEKQWTGLDPAKVRQVMAEREQREAALNLKPYNKGHQDYAKFQAVRSKAESYQQMLRNAPSPEAKEAIKAAGASMFNEQEIAMIEQSESDRQQLLAEFQSDPRAFLSEQMAPFVQAEIQKALTFQDQRQAAQQWMQDPKISNLMQTNAEDMAWVLDANVPGREKAIAFAAQKAEIEALKQRLGQQAQQQQTAEVRSQHGFSKPVRPAVGGAQVQKPKDPVAYLRDKGVQPGTLEFAAALQKINSGTYQY